MKKIEPVVKKCSFDEDDDKKDLQYWLRRSTEERIEAMSHLREHHFMVMGLAEPPRIEKIVTKRP
ncbi:MAG: hypothetical protein CVV44_06960 [Spirochaetae bacterium HGW-Spirochaetae-1]|jgi:hypothetical protein|nr:MAG: hypothetical protein CVV44_06960 [Spirochaetae bacterium HGW-Spirochaetae-1]